MAITTTGHTKMKQFLVDTVKEIRYKLNGVETISPLTLTEINDNDVSFYLMLGEDVQGDITNIRLYDTENLVFDTQPDILSKPLLNGLQIVFKYQIRRV